MSTDPLSPRADLEAIQRRYSGIFWHGPECSRDVLSLLAEAARLRAQNTAIREVLALGRRVMDGLMAGSSNDHSVWEGKTVSDRWFELRDEFRARLDAAPVEPAQAEQKAPSP